MSYAEKRAGKLTGRFVAERTISGMRLRERFDVKADADRWERIVDATGKPPMDGAGARVLNPFGSVAKQARAERAEWKRSNDVSLDQRLEVVVGFFGPLTALDDLTTAKVDEFIRNLSGRKGRDGLLSPKTINRYLSVLSAIIDFARRRFGFTKVIHIEWQEEAEGRIEYLRNGQDDLLLQHIESPAIRLCIQALIASGLRHGKEFFALKQDQIDIRDGLGWISVMGKNGSYDTVAIDAALAVPLKALVASGGLPTHDECYKAVKTAAAAIGLSEDFTLYSLRHTTGTRAARLHSGPMVQKFLRQRSYKSTQKYIHLGDDDVAMVANSLKKPLRTVSQSNEARAE